MAITDAQIDPEAPITSTLMYSLRDDPAALPISTFTNDSGYITGPTVATANGSNTSGALSTSVEATVTISGATTAANGVEIEFQCIIDDGSKYIVRGIAKVDTADATIDYMYMSEIAGGPYQASGNTTSATEKVIGAGSIYITITLGASDVKVKVRENSGSWTTGSDLRAIVSVNS